jgi:hypothetical protein
MALLACQTGAAIPCLAPQIFEVDFEADGEFFSIPWSTIKLRSSEYSTKAIGESTTLKISERLMYVEMPIVGGKLPAGVCSHLGRMQVVQFHFVVW